MFGNNLKALVVVLGIALTVFFIVRPICLRFMTAEVFRVRRNVWLVLTVAAFVSPSFWIYVACATPVIIWAARRDPNPLALYLLLALVISPFRYTISFGGSSLFALSQFRLLALLVLLPWWWRHVRSRDRSPGPFRAVDVLLLSYGCLQVATMIPYDSFTSSLRRAFMFFLDAYLIYYVASRSCTTREKLIDVMATFCLVGAIIAPLGVFETLKTWSLYGEISRMWDYSGGRSYIFREGLLRALVSTGHALGLGYFCGIAFGFWLYLKSHLHSKLLTPIAVVWIWAGLLAAYSRAPWLMAVLLFFAYMYFNPNGLKKFVKAALIFGVVAVVVGVSPIGDRVIDQMPFIGTLEEQNVAYRQNLAESTWAVVRQNPFFGDPTLEGEKEAMTNRQGIVDLVNAYAAVALFNGLVGLSIYVAFQLVAIWVAYPVMRRFRRIDPDFCMIGACLVASMIATIFFQVTSGFMWMQYVFTGLLLAYGSMGIRYASSLQEAPGRSSASSKRLATRFS